MKHNTRDPPAEDSERSVASLPPPRRAAAARSGRHTHEVVGGPPYQIRRRLHSPRSSPPPPCAPCCQPHSPHAPAPCAGPIRRSEFGRSLVRALSGPLRAHEPILSGGRSRGQSGALRMDLQLCVVKKFDHHSKSSRRSPWPSGCRLSQAASKRSAPLPPTWGRPPPTLPGPPSGISCRSFQ